MEKLLKLDPGNTELITQKHKLLGEAVAATKEKLETLKTAAEQANKALANGDISQEQYMRIIVNADIARSSWKSIGKKSCFIRLQRMPLMSFI